MVAGGSELGKALSPQIPITDSFSLAQTTVDLPRKIPFSNKTHPLSLLATAPFFRRHATILVGWIHRPRSTTINGIANSNNNQPRQRAILYRPRTEAGKSRAAQNARKHGLTSSHLIVVDSDREAFTFMRGSLAEELAPKGELECTLYDAILYANWNVRRCRILEAGLMKEDGVDPLLLDQNEAKLRQLDRHARRHNSNFHRAVKELRALQTERAFRELAAAPQNEPDAASSPLANTKAVHQAHLRQRAAKARIDALTLGLALDRVINHSPVEPILDLLPAEHRELGT